jgi:LysR family transcriptional regulator, low CO2-responsive transcriptional regulator
MDTSSTAELRAFDATMRTGNMSAAARLLGIRQPTVSAHIASLEQRFGASLFSRQGRALRPTEMALRLYEITNRIHCAEDAATRLLASVRSQYEGSLKICAIGPYNVLPIISAFRAQHPCIRIAVSVADSRRVVERVATHQDEIGVLLHAVEDPQIHCMPYRKQSLIVFAARGHPLCKANAIRLSALEGQEFVMREEGSRTRAVFEAGLAAAGVRVRCSIEMGSREAVREAVAQGLGLGGWSRNQRSSLIRV